jgi:protein-S-isoprenylcysteine O-methyltransferase Ste14
MGSGNLFKKKRILVSRLFAAMIGVLLLFSASRWDVVEVYSTGLFVLGVVMVGIATVGRVWCSLYISGRKSNELITTGPYSMCRNPLYFFSLVGAVGVGLTTETLTIALLLFIAFAGYYPFVIRAEQKRLAELHGPVYQQYLSSTPAFIPSLRRLHEPDQYMVKAVVFRKSLVDAMVFVWLIGVMEVLEALHESHILPVFIRLY